LDRLIGGALTSVLVTVAKGVSVGDGKAFVGVNAGVIVASGEGTSVEVDTLHDASRNAIIAYKTIPEKSFVFIVYSLNIMAWQKHPA